jgi:hypothetical protein
MPACRSSIQLFGTTIGKVLIDALLTGHRLVEGHQRVDRTGGRSVVHRQACNSPADGSTRR